MNTAAGERLRMWCRRGHGILAGDGLLNLAYETALTALEMEPENPNVGKALRILAKNAGIYGMLGGQVVDVESEGLPLSPGKAGFYLQSENRRAD